MSAPRAALIAAAAHPIAEPFAGGLESHVWTLARGLLDRGMEVTVFAPHGSDPGVGAVEIDFSSPGDAYRDLMAGLATEWAGAFDVIHNHSLHELPLARAATLPVPMLSTLHIPPERWLQRVVEAADCNVTFVAVSDFIAGAWEHLAPGARVIGNGVDVDRWSPGPGGGRAVWFGRLVPEKGPHLAMEAARRAGQPLVLAGPVSDRAYFEREIRPRLDDDVVYAGHLDHTRLCRLVGAASTALVTPRWDEPYGLVAAEALACGTPVCAFARGGLPGIIGDDAGILVEPDDVDGLATAMQLAPAIPRAVARRRAVELCSLERMIDGYAALYEELGQVAVP